jgi:hypothetical protein
MRFDVKQSIIDRLRETKRENIEKVIEYMEKHGFFSYHCHKHHKYRGGLASHAWQTYQIALRLDSIKREKNPYKIMFDTESIAIAALLHDICKCSGMREISGHGPRSAKMLGALGFRLLSSEFLAISGHMNPERHRNASRFKDERSWELCKLIHESDSISASLYKGYDEHTNQKLQYYLQNITKLDCKNVIYQTNEGWWMNLHSPYNGEIDLEFKSKIINVTHYNTAELQPINDSFIGAIFILGTSSKKGLFVIHHYFGMQGGAFLSPDKEPFVYSDIKVYCDWDKWSHFEGDCDNWSSYGYAACEQENGWKLVKVTQFPMPEYTIIGEGFSSAEEAMKSIGVDDCDKYLCKHLVD